MDTARKRKLVDPGAFIAKLLRMPLAELRGFDPLKAEIQPVQPVTRTTNGAAIHRSPVPEADPIAKERAKHRRARDRLIHSNGTIRTG